MGIFVLLALLNINTKRIIIIEKNEKKLNYLKKLKLNVELIKFNRNLKENILKKNINKLADYIIDCTGNIVSMNNCLNLIKKMVRLFLRPIQIIKINLKLIRTN